MPGHRPGWPPIHTKGASNGSGRIAAIPRIAGQAAAGSGLTTSSLSHLLADPGAGTSRQAQNTDESGGIFLVVAFTHGERREIGSIEREFRIAACHQDVALIQP